jgi:hypothetical protein
MHLAFKYAVFAIVLAKANFYSDQLNLPTKHPIERSDLTFSFIVPTDAFPAVDLGGAIDIAGLRQNLWVKMHEVSRVDPCDRNRARASPNNSQQIEQSGVKTVERHVNIEPNETFRHRYYADSLFHRTVVIF